MSEPSPRVTRRGLLRTGIATTIVGLPGCSTTNDSPGTQTPETRSVFRNVAVEKDELVVELHDDRDVSKVTLVKPDGSLYGKRTISPGVTAVRFQLIELELGRSKHYTPGEYKLVADSDDHSESRTIELQPDLQIQEIKQYTGTDIPAADARIAVIAQNVGSAPTWIYDIVYRDAPNWTANEDLGTRPGIPHLSKPDQIDNLILRPGTSQTYVGSNQPLRFAGQDSGSCDTITEMRIIVGTATGNRIERRIRVAAGGSSKSPSTREGHLCTDVSVNVLKPTSTTTEVDPGGD